MMRLEKYSIDSKSIEKIIHESPYGILSLVNCGDKPYAVPLNYVFYDGRIYLHCAAEGEKIKAIQNNDNICFTIVGRVNIKGDIFNTEYESVLIFGKIQEICTENEKERALVRITQKYSGLSEEIIIAKCRKCGSRTRVYEIAIDSVSGKSNIGKI